MFDNRDVLIDILKQAVRDHQPRLELQLRKKLNLREEAILNWLLLRYQDENHRRWYDAYHVLFSTGFALALVEEEKLDRLIVIGIMLHDIGYSAIENKTQWSNPENRIVHMQEGVAIAARVLSEHNYTPVELEKILGMIAVHDNPYVGIEIKGRDRLGLRDCDRVWVMHLLSFYKDLASRIERSKYPQEFLFDRMTQFYAWKHPFGDEWAVSIERIKKNADRIEVPTFDFTKKAVNKQFEQRIKELQIDRLLQDTVLFREYVFDQIGKEILEKGGIWRPQS